MRGVGGRRRVSIGSGDARHTGKWGWEWGSGGGNGTKMGLFDVELIVKYERKSLLSGPSSLVTCSICR